MTMARIIPRTMRKAARLGRKTLGRSIRPTIRRSPSINHIMRPSQAPRRRAISARASLIARQMAQIMRQRPIIQIMAPNLVQTMRQIIAPNMRQIIRARRLSPLNTSVSSRA